MRKLILAGAAVLALVVATPGPTRAQFVVINGATAPAGFTSISAPYYFGSYSVSNGNINAFPSFPSPFYQTGFPPAAAFPNPIFQNAAVPPAPGLPANGAPSSNPYIYIPQPNYGFSPWNYGAPPGGWGR